MQHVQKVWSFNMDNKRRDNRRDNRDQPIEEKLFDERVMNIDRVARVVKGGRRFRFRALVVVGDKKGKIGIGIAKGADVTSAVAKAVDAAKKKMVAMSLNEGTLPHEAQAKVGGANILIKPASPGTGLIAGGVVRTILEVAGVSNALSKSLGSSNKVNTAYATFEALCSLVPRSQWVKPAQALPKNIKPTVKATAKKVTTKKETK
jgi:small subunit ribosomal protein S5